MKVRNRMRRVLMAAAATTVLASAGVGAAAVLDSGADQSTSDAPAPSTAPPNPEAKHLLDEINQLTASPRAVIPQEDQNRIASLMVQYAQLTGRGVPWAADLDSGADQSTSDAPAPSTAPPSPEAQHLLDEINQLTASPRAVIPQEDQNRIASLMVQYAQLTGRGVPWAGGR